MTIHTEQELLALCLALIGRQDGLSAAERKLAKTVRIPASRHPEMEAIRLAISDGNDPLGDIFTSIRTAAERRSAGAIYTPAPIVHSMMAWLAGQGTPARIVDPGAGSGRFILAAGATFPDVPLVAVEQDPLAALMLRANLSARGWADRTTVLVKDYREVKLPRCTGMTAFVGNPPYVRHHDITEDWKAWYASTFARFGIIAAASSDAPVVPVNALAGLQTMVTRRDILGRPCNLEEAVPLEDALRAYTVNGAYASREEGSKGMLRPGLLGDVTVFETDLFAVAPNALATLQVDYTIADGEVVFERGA